MRGLRILKRDVWYEIHTGVNNREPLFRLGQALALFSGVLGEARGRFVFEIRGLCLADDLLSFYIKPADGLSLPDILKWLKQTFAVRYNVKTGRIGHIWGDRYRSVIVEGEPPEDGREEAGGESEAAELGAAAKNGVRPQYGERAAAEPGATAKIGVRPRPEEEAVMAGFFSISLHSPSRPPP